MNEREFRNAFFVPLHEVRCGHSQLISSKGRQKYLAKRKIKYLPFWSVIVDNQLFITENKSIDSSLIKGTEVLSIEGKPVKECIEALRTTISTDGYNTTHAVAALRNEFSSFYYYRLFEERDTFSLRVKDVKGTIRIVRVPCLEADNLPPMAKTATKNTI